MLHHEWQLTSGLAAGLVFCVTSARTDADRNSKAEDITQNFHYQNWCDVLPIVLVKLKYLHIAKKMEGGFI